MSDAGKHANYPDGVKFPAVDPPTPHYFRRPGDPAVILEMVGERAAYDLEQKGWTPVEAADLPANTDCTCGFRAAGNSVEEEQAGLARHHGKYPAHATPAAEGEGLTDQEPELAWTEFVCATCDLVPSSDESWENHLRKNPTHEGNMDGLPSGPARETEPPESGLEGLTVAQLKDYAGKVGIDVTGIRRHGELIAAITGAQMEPVA